MVLAAGTRFGPYEILAPIGAGGMGEVYRARDTKLDREVAIKVLPAALAQDPERLARFEREAKILAALNHPNIAQIYSVEERALVMELVPGESLKGPLPLETALKYAKQIADALEAAHDKGIIHRDLKPANIMVTPRGVVKVLDFGLAAVPSRSPAGADPASSLTMTIAATQAGMIMGTAAYMSPEQAAGKPVDKRADIWSFGVVLFEMLTGKRLFDGETISHTLAAVLTKEPDLKQVPVKARRLLQSCLEKDPRQRLRDIGDMGMLLSEGESTATPSGSRLGLTGRIAFGAAVVFALGAATLAFIHFREKPPVQEVVRFQIPAPEESALSPAVTVSPDGRKLAFMATGPDNIRHLWIRPLDSLAARIVADVGPGSIFPFWSPDSSSLGFWTQGKLKKVEASGGSPQTLCDVPGRFYGGAWSPDGVIIFGYAGGGLWQVSADGGTAGPLTKLDPARREDLHAFPSFLPDGRHFVYLRNSTNREISGIFVGSLDAKPEQQSSRQIAATPNEAVYVPSTESSKNGYLLFTREETLVAQPFDMERMNLTGKTVPLLGQVQVGTKSAYAFFSASSNGVLAYRSGIFANTRLTWYDRQGEAVGMVGEPGQYIQIALSPDDTRIAMARRDPLAVDKGGQNGNLDIWLHELARGISTRFTFDLGAERMPIWSPDGSSIAFTSNRDGPYNIYQKPSSGAGNDEALLKSGEDKFLQDWSPDGRFLLYATQSHGTGLDLWALPLTGDNHKPSLYLKTELNEDHARFSPDGRFVAYTSSESGKNEIYVRPFPAPSGGKWMISTDGGFQPRWRRNGKELFYVSANAMLMAVEVNLSPVFKAGIPKALFPVSYYGGDNGTARYDVTADGRRFLINSMITAPTSGDLTSPPMTVVLNWQASLKK
ncbi:MAG: protein kinase [Bryobacteraceae bacterium]|jgi:Tol biopolymer transport system component/predicted Ser/Thr protein kinase